MVDIRKERDAKGESFDLKDYILEQPYINALREAVEELGFELNPNNCKQIIAAGVYEFNSVKNGQPPRKMPVYLVEMTHLARFGKSADGEIIPSKGWMSEKNFGKLIEHPQHKGVTARNFREDYEEVYRDCFRDIMINNQALEVEVRHQRQR